MDTDTPPLDAGSVTEAARLRALAESVDCIAEPDLCLLADIAPATAESWRKRGKGPAYVLIGNRYLYPRTAVAEFIRSNVRERQQVSVRGLL